MRRLFCNPNQGIGLFSVCFASLLSCSLPDRQIYAKKNGPENLFRAAFVCQYSASCSVVQMLPSAASCCTTVM